MAAVSGVVLVVGGAIQGHRQKAAVGTAGKAHQAGRARREHGARAVHHQFRQVAPLGQPVDALLGCIVIVAVAVGAGGKGRGRGVGQVFKHGGHCAVGAGAHQLHAALLIGEAVKRAGLGGVRRHAGDEAAPKAAQQFGHLGALAGGKVQLPGAHRAHHAVFVHQRRGCVLGGGDQDAAQQQSLPAAQRLQVGDFQDPFGQGDLPKILAAGVLHPPGLVVAAVGLSHGGDEAAAVRHQAGHAEVIGPGLLGPVGGLLLPGGAVVGAGPEGDSVVAPFFQQQKGAVLQKHRLFVAAGVFAGGDLLLPPAAGARGGTAAPGGGRAGAGGRLFAAAEEPGSHHRRQRKSRGAFCNGVFFHVVLLPFHPNAGYGSSIAAPA